MLQGRLWENWRYSACRESVADDIELPASVWESAKKSVKLIPSMNRRKIYL